MTNVTQTLKNLSNLFSILIISYLLNVTHERTNICFANYHNKIVNIEQNLLGKTQLTTSEFLGRLI